MPAHTAPAQLLERLGRFKHIIWDWNGTLINDAPLASEIVNSLLSAYQLPLTNLAEYRATFCHPVEAYYQNIGLLAHLSFDQICVRFGQDYHAARDGLSLHAGAYDLVRQLAANHTQSLLSASSQNSLNHCLAHHQLTEYFDHIYGLDNHHAASKIERGHELMAKVGIAAADTVLIGDTDHDYEVAEALGINLILIAAGHQSEHSLQQLGAELYSNWQVLR